MQLGLQFVQIVRKVRVAGFQSLPLLGVLHDGVGLGVLLHWVSGQDLPVVKHALREGLAASVGSQVSREAERLVDGQIGLHHEHGGAGGLGLLEHVASPSVEHTVDTSHSVLRTLDLDLVDGLHQPGLSSENTGIQDTSSRGDDLATTAMDGISVESYVIKIEPDSSDVLVAESSLLGSPLEAGNTGVLDFIEILNSLGAVNKDVGSKGLGAEAPDLPGLGDVIVVLIGEVTGSGLQLVPGVHLAVVDVLSQTVGHGDGPHEEPVVLVGRLGQTHLAGLLRDRLPVGDNRVGLLQRNLGVILLQILQTDLEVELSSASNDVLSRLLDDALHHGVRLGQSLKSLHELGEVSRVLGLHSHSHHGGHRELHHLHVVRLLEGGEGASLHQELIHTNQTADVTSRNILDGLDTSTHHQDCPLDRFLIEIVLLARDVVGSHDPALLSSGHHTSEHTAEGVESSLVRGGHHLTDVHHQGAGGVTGLDGGASSIVRGSLVQQLGSVLLSGDRRGQVDDDHLEHRLAGWQPVPHHTLHQRLPLQLLLLVFQDILDQLAVSGGQLTHQLLNLVLLEVHDSVKDHVDGVQDVHVEGSLVVSVLVLAPLLRLGVEEVLTPELLHHLVGVDSKLGGVHLSKLLQGEGPSVKSRSKTNRGVVDINPDGSHGTIIISVGGDNDVDVLDNS